MSPKKIAFIGAGNMSRALVTGLIAFGYNPDHLWVSNPNQEKLDFFHQTFGVHTRQDNREASADADVIVLAIKPNTIPAVLAELKELLQQQNKLIVSVAVGATCDQMQNWLDNKQQAIVRAIPNTPSATGTGATGLFANNATSSEQKNYVESLFRAVGVTLWVNKESEIHSVSALAASGPAYVLFIMEAMQQAGTALGLEDKTARLLTEQTVLGTVKMALETGQDVAQLRQAVTSPQGTTEAAIKKLEQGNIKALLQTALQAAKDRAEEITKTLSDS